MQGIGMEREKIFSGAKTVVVKIGTNVLTKTDGSLDTKYIARIAGQVAALKKRGRRIILVSSGAIGSGVRELGLKNFPRSIPMRQAAAAVGQSLLMQHYREQFRKHGIAVAQLLLTYDAFSRRATYLNLRRSLNELLAMGVVPVINENDPISISEIGAGFGDNDRMSAMVAGKLDASILVILSDVDGLYTGNPRRDRKAELIKTVFEVDSGIMKLAGGRGTVLGLGGMKAKVEAAQIAAESGCFTVIANGRTRDVLGRLFRGEELGTLFCALGKLASRERWIRFARSDGAILVDDGAKKALQGRKSLLPSGILGVNGSFARGSIVSIMSGNREFARGIADYSATELQKIKGMHTKNIKGVLGYSNGAAVKTCNLVLE